MFYLLQYILLENYLFQNTKVNFPPVETDVFIEKRNLKVPASRMRKFSMTIQYYTHVFILILGPIDVKSQNRDIVDRNRRGVCFVNFLNT